MSTDGSPLCDSGISYPLATEIGRQMTAGVGNANLLCALGLNAGPAIELARQINTGTFSDDLLARAMWNPVTATAVATLGGTGKILVSPYLGQVATKSRIPNSNSTANKQLMSRSHHIARDTITSLQIGLPAWQWGSAFTTTTETAAGGNITYTASIEYPAGTFTQVKFGGSASGVATDNTTLLSDAVSVSIPNGAAFWVRTFGTAISSIVYNGSHPSTPISPQCDVSNGEAMTFAASGIVDQTMGGTVVATVAGSQGPMLSPVFIVGMTKKPSVLLLGDSRVFGAGDIYTSSGDLGEEARSIGPYLGYINAGCFGDDTGSYIAGHTNRAALATYCSHIFIELGINDLPIPRTAATVLANHQTIIGLFPGKIIYQQTLPPRTTSTDSFATTGNQTLPSYQAQIVAFNTAIRSGQPGVTGFFEIADTVESARNSGLWKVDGTAFKYTVDGIHESPFGYLAEAASGAINPASIVIPVPVLDFNFVTGSFLPGPLSAKLVDTRASSKFITDASGNLTSIAANTLPNNSTGLLIEPAATNLFLQSGNFSIALWLQVSGGVFASCITAPGGLVGPDGVTQAYQIALTGANASGNWAAVQQSFTFPNSTSGAVSLYVRSSASGGASNISIVTNNNVAFGTGIYQRFPLTANWQRITLTGTLATGGTQVQVNIGNLASAASPPLADSGCNGNVDIAFASIEQTAFATSYIPTTSAAASRSADAAVIQPIGIGRIVFTFDDSSLQTVAGINTAAQFTIPTTLNRPLIKRLQGYAS